MSVSYKKPSRLLEDSGVAYLDVLRLDADGAFYGAVLLLDGRGLPLEFVHNRLVPPSGLLWTEPDVSRQSVIALSRSLFDACRREPDLLLCLPTLGSPDFCRVEIAPVLPFAQVIPPQEDIPAGVVWINEPPAVGMRGHHLYQELLRRDALFEPFDRLRKALGEVYPQAPWLSDSGGEAAPE